MIVFADFTADLHDGAGGATNGTADWIDNLLRATTAAGVSAFSTAERSTIESSILSKLDTMYGSYDATFTTTQPGGSHERINFGAYDGTAGNLGLAPLDFMNLYASTDTDEDTAAKVFSNNFGIYIESTDSRATQIAEFSASLAGTGGHELGHSVGLLHHHAYGDPGITPANYANTGDIQNDHIMATGSTGLSETGRETDRTFSTMSNLHLEAAGGANAVFGTTGTALAATVLQQSNSDYGGTDTGDTTGTATALSLTSLPISGLNAAHTLGELDASDDVDVYSFTINSAAQLYAQIWSDGRFANAFDFDGELRLFDTDGLTVLANNGDVRYDGNTFNSGTIRGYDSALVGIPLDSAGTYFLEVSNVGAIPGSGAANDGGLYSLIFGADDVSAVPEPSSLALGMLGTIVFGALRLRRRRKDCAGEMH